MTDFRPGNYSVHFIEEVDRMRATCPPKWFANLQWLCRKMESAQHFQMPDDGRIIEMKEMPEEMPLYIRPPFPVTVIEYSANDNVGDDLLSCVKSSRRIVVAIEHAETRDLPHKNLLAHGGGQPDDGVWLVPIAYSDTNKMWSPPSCMFFLRYEQQVRMRSAPFPEVAAKLSISQDHEIKGLEMSVAALAIEIFDGSTGHIRNEAALEHMLGCCAADAQHELFAYQQLAVALACSNVSAEKVRQPDKLNKARAKSGKRALFDYHVLTVPGGDNAQSGEGTGRAVRSHLRRGHIRRIKPGRIIWINATMVKGGAAGFVSKSYSAKVE